MNLDPERIANALERYAADLRADDARALVLAARIDRCHLTMADADAKSGPLSRLILAQLFIGSMRLNPERHYGPAVLVELLVDAHGPGEPGESVPLSTFEAFLDALRTFAIVERTSLGSPAARQLRASISQAELETVRALWAEQDPRRPNGEERWPAGGPETAVQRIAEAISSLYASTVREQQRRDVRLTPRELQIAELVADGFTNTEIAEQLRITPRAVETYVFNIFARLSVASRVGVAQALNRQRRADHQTTAPTGTQSTTDPSFESARSAPLEVSEEQPTSTGPSTTMGRTRELGPQRLIHRLVLAVDIEKYASRDARAQRLAHADLQNVLNIAGQNVGIDRELWYAQVSGDGELVVLPENADVSIVVGDFTRELETILGRFNRESLPSPRLRIRLALHHGTLTLGPFGPAGDAPIVVSRLLDSKPLRRLLIERQESDVALILSYTLFQDVVRTGFCSLNPDAFRPVVVNAKGVQSRGFILEGAASAPYQSETPNIRAANAYRRPCR